LLSPAGATGRPSVPGDPTPPVVTPVIHGTLGANGWYVSNVTVNWRVEDPESIILETHGCEARTLVADTVGTSFTCYARSDGGETTVRIVIRLDRTPPVVTSSFSRPPDAGGWYNHPVTVAFAGTDPTSGVGSCSQASYSGPDNARASVAGFCRDLAGNEGTASAVLKYDATAPQIRLFVIKARKHSAELHWRPSSDTRSVEIVRSPGLGSAEESVVYSGPGTVSIHLDKGLRAGRTYHYRLNAADEAANTATRTLAFVGRGALLYPAPRARIRSAPLLVWARVQRASYYNVVLFYRDRRVFSSWPLRPRLQLPRAWVFRGRQRRLRAGLYRWYVWPGFGELWVGRYGRLLGGSTFVVSH
jgi:hypothetical protein